MRRTKRMMRMMRGEDEDENEDDDPLPA